MRFLREYLILLFIIIFIIGSDFFISKITKELIEKMDVKINLIDSKLFVDDYNKEEIMKEINEFEGEWKVTEDKMSYFAEHEELEKVSAEIVAMKSNLEMDRKQEAYENIEKIKFKIEHIKNKQKFELNNVF